MIMMIAASLMWAGAVEMPEQSKMTFKNYQNDSKQLTKLPNQIQSKSDEKDSLLDGFGWSVG